MATNYHAEATLKIVKLPVVSNGVAIEHSDAQGDFPFDDPWHVNGVLADTGNDGKGTAAGYSLSRELSERISAWW